MKRSTQLKLFKKIKFYHQWLALILSLPIALWFISGIMQPVLGGWFSKELPRVEVIEPTLHLNQWQYSIHQIEQDYPTLKKVPFRLLMIKDQLYYQFKEIKVTDSEKENSKANNVDIRLHYINATTGKEEAEVYRDYVDELVAQRVKNKYEIKSIELLKEFDIEYSYINRYLPAYKVEIEGEYSGDIYFDAFSGKLATFNSPVKIFYRKCFYWFHNFGILDFMPKTLSYLLLLLTLLGYLFVVLSGLYMYYLKKEVYEKLKIKTEKQRLNILHLDLGLWLSAFCLMFFISSVVQLSYNYLRPDKKNYVYEYVKTNTERMIDLDSLKIRLRELEPIKDIRFNDELRVEALKGKEVYYPLNNDLNDSLKAIQLLAKDQRCSGKVVRSEVLNRFGSEYGHMEKVFPVYGFTLESKTTCYVSTQQNNIQTVYQTSDRIARFIFSTFHKFNFTDALYKATKDMMLIVSSLFILALIVVGIRVKFTSNKKKLKE